MQWEMVLGLEVHTQLATKSKLFSAAATEYGAKPNHQACPVDLAYPGMLPVLNPEVFNMAVKFGLSIDEIADNLCRSRKTIFCHLVSCQRKANSKTLFHLGSLVVQITM